MVCPLWKLAPYTARLAFADYWKDASDEATYLERSRWLADINNERPQKRRCECPLTTGAAKAPAKAPSAKIGAPLPLPCARVPTLVHPPLCLLPRCP